MLINSIFMLFDSYMMLIDCRMMNEGFELSMNEFVEELEARLALFVVFVSEADKIYRVHAVLMVELWIVPLRVC